MFLPFFSCIWKTPASRITDGEITTAKSVTNSSFDAPGITDSSYDAPGITERSFDAPGITDSSYDATGITERSSHAPGITERSSDVPGITDSSSSISVGKSIFDTSRITDGERMTGITDRSSKSTQTEEYTLDQLACFLDAQNCLKNRITNETSNDVLPIEIASIPMNQIILVIILVAEIGLVLILIFINLMICRFQNNKKNSSQNEPIVPAVPTSIENQNFNFSLTQEIGDVKTVAKEKISHFQPDSEDNEIYFVER